MCVKMSEKLLVVDDEREIADLVALYLGNEGYDVRVCYDGAHAISAIDSEAFDLAVLDVMLPDVSGFDICRHIRKAHTFPVIMLTAREEELDKITGLTMGADDYVTKPFRPLELVARVKAQLRRYTRYNPGAAADSSLLAVRGLSLDTQTHECMLDERPVALTPTEFSILSLLMEVPGRVISSEELFERVWGEKYLNNSNNTVMVHIRHLREKLHDTSERPRYIKTVWGVGYKIEKRL